MILGLERKIQRCDLIFQGEIVNPFQIVCQRVLDSGALRNAIRP